MKLNLASHGDHQEGYTSVDFDDETADIRADVSDMHMIEDESVEEILAFHILEHFRAGNKYEPHLSNPLNPNTVMDALAEWRRVLKPDGILYIKVPDIDKIFWLRHNCQHWALGDGGNPPFRAYSDWICSNGQHQCVFDKDTMREVLKLAGFRDVEFLDPPIEAKIDRANIEMYVKCRK